MNHKLSRKIFIIGLFATIAVAILATLLMKEWLIWVCVGVFVLNLFQQSIFDKCPNCGEWFNFRASEPDYCPKCGKKLDEK